MLAISIRMPTSTGGPAGGAGGGVSGRGGAGARVGGARAPHLRSRGGGGCRSLGAACPQSPSRRTCCWARRRCGRKHKRVREAAGRPRARLPPPARTPAALTCAPRTPRPAPAAAAAPAGRPAAQPPPSRPPPHGGRAADWNLVRSGEEKQFPGAGRMRGAERRGPGVPLCPPRPPGPGRTAARWRQAPEGAGC